MKISVAVCTLIDILLKLQLCCSYWLQHIFYLGELCVCVCVCAGAGAGDRGVETVQAGC